MLSWMDSVQPLICPLVILKFVITQCKTWLAIMPTPTFILISLETFCARGHSDTPDGHTEKSSIAVTHTSGLHCGLGTFEPPGFTDFPLIYSPTYTLNYPSVLFQDVSQQFCYHLECIKNSEICGSV